MNIRYTVLVLSILCPFLSDAQGFLENKSKKQLRSYQRSLDYYEAVIGENDPDFSVTTALSKWKEEPIIVLCQKIHIGFLNDFKGLNIGRGRFKEYKPKFAVTKGAVRKRILIQDKAVLADFSEFYFQDADAIGIKHIKPDGTIREIDLENAIKVESDIPTFYADRYHSDENYKIVIPDLEVGDILDFYKVFSQNYTDVAQLIIPIASDYPIVKQDLIFEADKRWGFYYNSFNGAPRFIQDENGGFDLKGQRKKSIRRYILRDNDRNLFNDERWDFSNLTEPIIKITAVPPISSMDWLGINDNTGEGLKLKGIFKFAMRNGRYSAGVLKLKIMKNLHKQDLSNLTEIELINTIYNTVRFTFEQYSSSYRPGGPSADPSPIGQYYQMKNYIFAPLFADLLTNYKVNCDLVLVVPRFYGRVEDVVTPQEVEFGVFVPSTDTYFWSVDNFRNPIDKYNKVSGGKGYRVSPQQVKKKNPVFEMVEIPLSEAHQNVMSTKLDIAIQGDHSLEVNSRIQFAGTYKEQMNLTLLYQTQYEIEDFYYLSSPKARAKLDRKGGLAKPLNEMSSRKRSMIEEWVKSDFELTSLNNFQVISYGRYPMNSLLEVDLSFTATGYVKKAGQSLIFDVGKLITEQVRLDNEEKVGRIRPVELGHAKTINNEFRVLVPKGYQIQGLDNLKMSVDNSVSSFNSTAIQDGNVLTVKTSKVYKKEIVPASEWPSLVEMLEAAYDFSQKKVILKK